MRQEKRETLLLLPGMLCDARLFAPQIDALSASVDVVVADPGDLAESTIDAMAKRILQKLSASRINVAGLSMGGIVAMAMLRLAPERIARLALLDTNHLADPPERLVVRERQIAAVQSGHLRSVLVDEMKPHYLAKRHRHDTELLGLLIDMGISLGDEVFVAQSRALARRPDASTALQAFTGPSLVLCGEEDRLCPVARHEAIAALLPDSELQVLPETGHISTLESADAVNAALSSWLIREAATAADPFRLPTS